MSLMDKIKSFFSGGSSSADPHAGHEHAATEPSAPMTPADPGGMPMREPAETAEATQPAEPEEERTY